MKITKEKLEKLYHSMSNDELCKKLGVSKMTLSNYIKKAGIEPKGKGNRNPSSKVKIID